MLKVVAKHISRNLLHSSEKNTVFNHKLCFIRDNSEHYPVNEQAKVETIESGSVGDYSTLSCDMKPHVSFKITF